MYSIQHIASLLTSYDSSKFSNEKWFIDEMNSKTNQIIKNNGSRKKTYQQNLNMVRSGYIKEYSIKFLLENLGAYCDVMAEHDPANPQSYAYDLTLDSGQTIEVKSDKFINNIQKYNISKYHGDNERFGNGDADYKSVKNNIDIIDFIIIGKMNGTVMEPKRIINAKTFLNYNVVNNDGKYDISKPEFLYDHKKAIEGLDYINI